MKKIFLLLGTLAWISSVSAQMIFPPKSVVSDTVRAQCQWEVDRINTMVLECDTIQFDETGISYDFKGIYFDEEGLFRKYFRKMIISDASYEGIILSVYYNRNGELVYLYFSTSSHINGAEQSYYVQDGKIVDFAFEYYSDFDDDTFTPTSCPVIGDPLIKLIWGDLRTRNFIHANTLLDLLKRKENTEFDELYESNDTK